MMTGNAFLRASAALVVLAFAAACAEDPAPPFAVMGSGRLTGQLFFDADNNGLFTPLGGDTLLRNVSVELRGRGSSVIMATIRTDAAGSFTFNAVPPGTHDVFLVQDTAITKNLVFCANPLRASVYRDETAFVAGAAKRGCVVRINVAEATALGTAITVAGIVTARQGTYRNDNIYIQDPTGGMQVFGLPALNLQLGDSIEVSGALGQFGGELQVINPIVAPNRKTGAPVPDPFQRTTGALAAAVAAGGARTADIGRLLVVRRASVGGFTSGNASLNDGSGGIQIRLDGNVAGTIPTTRFDPAKCYDIIGILGFFNGTPQLKPRMPTDVTEVPCQ
jgi:hypothetical protein